MFVRFLDASKAFDRVDYSILFRNSKSCGASLHFVSFVELVWPSLCHNTVGWNPIR